MVMVYSIYDWYYYISAMCDDIYNTLQYNVPTNTGNMVQSHLNPRFLSLVVPLKG